MNPNDADRIPEIRTMHTAMANAFNAVETDAYNKGRADEREKIIKELREAAAIARDGKAIHTLATGIHYAADILEGTE